MHPKPGDYCEGERKMMFPNTDMLKGLVPFIESRKVVCRIKARHHIKITTSSLFSVCYTWQWREKG